jgi:alpha-ribazole phosphatase
MDFGHWDGRAWADIAWAEVAAWQADLLHHAPGCGESLAQLAQRVFVFAAEAQVGGTPRLLVTHGGWLNAGLHVPARCSRIDAATWPAAPRHGSLSRLAGAT